MAITTEQTVEKFKAVHGSTYDYSKVKYVSARVKVKIKCQIHGIFEQTPNSHLRGAGCPSCGHNRTAKAKTKTSKQFISEAKAVQTRKYDYSKVVYTGDKIPVVIGCPKHGFFEQTPNAHLAGKGCFDCSVSFRANLKRLNVEIFRKRARLVHGDTYDYSKTQYFGMLEKLEIVCRTHGVFHQVAAAHVKGVGCAKCSNYGFNLDSPACFYVIETDLFIGYGITNYLEQRIQQHLKMLKLHFYPVLSIRFCSLDTGREALKLEKKIKRKAEAHVYVDIPGFRTEALRPRFCLIS